ncbi:MAG TPA: carboxypeptidase-like regulatory domain-containing protein [Acidobacteriaceae bacterium]|jgi:hypothetical protein|nr:carboxypeptidase-like regulatory domain-containing protein [Acidobacteriaceae bacterium]
MQHSLKQWAKVAVVLFAAFAIVSTLPSFEPVATAQSLSAGDIAGTVVDPTGAAIPGAQVVVKNTGTGATYNLTTNATGGYRSSLLQPGMYSVTVTTAGFETSSTIVTVNTGAIANGNVKMSVGKSSQTVTVTAAEPLLNTDNADISTTFNQKQVQNLPNPGNDLTFVAQTAPGVVMNSSTASNGAMGFGYGNFSAFGLPATSNTFTLNGMYENDPFLNLNNSGATNLLLGNNAVAQVAVVNNAYGAQYGGLGGAQVNEITKSGTNVFHGNAAYWWNGRTMNANDFFNNQTATPRPFDNVNQFAASIGGPIWKNKTFFFGDYEGLRVVIPVVSPVYSPTAQYMNRTYANLAANGAPASTVALYKQLFSVYTSANGYSSATPVPATGIPTGLLPGDIVTYNSNTTNFTHEWLFEGRIDHHISDKDNLYGTYEMDRGLQATYTDPLSPIFNADSPQPQYSGQLGETHVFNPNFTNQFTFATLWYQAVFNNTNLASSLQQVPYTLVFAFDNAFSQLGGINYVWPQGRTVTNYQFIDDASVIKGRNTIKFGYYFRRDDITDYSPSVNTVPLLEVTGADFAMGTTDIYAQQYPLRLTQPVALYNEAFYVQDAWKAMPNLTLTAAVRLELNSNPVCQTNCFDSLSSNFGALSASATTPYKALINSGRHAAFPGYQAVAVQPRFGFAWSPAGDGSKTVVRGGFGMFSDVFPGTIADSALNNAPTNVGFTLFGGPQFKAANISPDPSQASSGEAITAASNKAFQAGFHNGASYNSLAASVAGFSAPSFTNPYSSLKYPTYEEWNLEIERQLNASTVVDVNYVGNRGYHEPDANDSLNSYGGPAGFTGVNGANAPNGSFGAVTEVYSNAVSNYHGIVASVTNRSRYLLLQANYTYSHALDEISNGGILPFSGADASLLSAINPFDLSQNYGNADYDVRHNITASYVFTVPYWGGPHVATDGWQLAGTVFHHTGFPFSVVDGAVVPTNYASNSAFPVSILAHQLNNVHSCGGSGVFNFATGTGNPCGIANGANYTTPTAFGQQARNQTYGPAYTDTDFSLLKGFKIPGWESSNLQVGAQFFNLLNHPNFATPGHDINSPGQLGFITSTVNTPTSILGSGLGGDASPRLVQLKASLTF